MKRRLLTLALLALAIAPGTWVRTTSPPADYDSGVVITRLATDAETGPLRVVDLWELDSRNSLFGSYSSLRATAPGTYLSISDKGTLMRFAIEGDRLSVAGLDAVTHPGEFRHKFDFDIEALAVDPDSGRLWLAYEGQNAIERRDPDMANPKRVQPRAMQQWLSNSGPEAMLRFPDGSFLVIGEGTRAWSDMRLPAVRFASDPVERAEAIGFAFRAPEDFRPTDMAALPDGRVLILIRRIRWGLPPGFEVGLVVADPAEIAKGRTWTGTLLTTFMSPFPTDNYEGLSVEATDGGYPVTLTLISDDNGISYQRTLVAQLEWDGTMPEG